ncbi:hypothetical protein GCM10009841_13600 [Microlunatus panaciterrae]
MIVIAVALVACSRMKAAMISTISMRLTGAASELAKGVVGLPDAAVARAAALRWVIMIAVVVMLSTATAAMASRMARLPNQPMMKVASGGPPTQATDTMARVLTISAGLAPEWRSWANSMELPTPAGPPIRTSAMVATGRVVVIASTMASTAVSAPQTSIGLR